MMLLRTILEGLILGALLIIVCAFGIRSGAVGMVFLYSPEVQARCVQNGLITKDAIRRNRRIFKAACIPTYIGYVIICAYAINGARLYRGLLADVRDAFRDESDRLFSG